MAALALTNALKMTAFHCQSQCACVTPHSTRLVDETHDTCCSPVPHSAPPSAKRRSIVSHSKKPIKNVFQKRSSTFFCAIWPCLAARQHFRGSHKAHKSAPPLVDPGTQERIMTSKWFRLLQAPGSGRTAPTSRPPAPDSPSCSRTSGHLASHPTASYSALMSPWRASQPHSCRFSAQ